MSKMSKMDIDAQNANRYNVLARLLAIGPDGSYRDGDKAVQLAEKACEDHSLLVVLIQCNRPEPPPYRR